MKFRKIMKEISSQICHPKSIIDYSTFYLLFLFISWNIRLRRYEAFLLFLHLDFSICVSILSHESFVFCFPIFCRLRNRNLKASSPLPLVLRQAFLFSFQLKMSCYSRKKLERIGERVFERCSETFQQHFTRFH